MFFCDLICIYIYYIIKCTLVSNFSSKLVIEICSADRDDHVQCSHEFSLHSYSVLDLYKKFTVVN